LKILKDGNYGKTWGKFFNTADVVDICTSKKDIIFAFDCHVEKVKKEGIFEMVGGVFLIILMIMEKYFQYKRKKQFFTRRRF